MMMMMMIIIIIIIIIVLLYTSPDQDHISNWIGSDFFHLFRLLIPVSGRIKKESHAPRLVLNEFLISSWCPLLSFLLPSARPTWSCLLSSSNTSAPRNRPIVATRCLTRSHPSARRCLPRQKHRRLRCCCSSYCFCQTTTLSRRRSTNRTLVGARGSTLLCYYVARRLFSPQMCDPNSVYKTLTCNTLNTSTLFLVTNLQKSFVSI